jgi:hypothetical protein
VQRPHSSFANGLAAVAVALVSRGLFHGRALVYRTVRVRPSLVAAGISLLSASFILFMLNLSGPVP